MKTSRYLLIGSWALGLLMLAACAPVLTPAIQKIIYVAPETVECVGSAGLQPCYQIRESPAGDWRPFPGTIEGFEHEAGYFYELRVEEQSTTQAPGTWKLLEVLSKARALDVQAFANKIWHLQALTYQGQTVPLDEAVTTTLVFDPTGQVNGTGGCNAYFASYKVTGPETLAFSAIGATKLACAQGMEQETLYFTALETTRKVSLTAESLTLTSPDGSTILTFALRT